MCVKEQDSRIAPGFPNSPILRYLGISNRMYLKFQIIFHYLEKKLVFEYPSPK